MNDGLGYIRSAIQTKGPNTMVEVVRWEKDSKTGYYNRPFKLLIKADIALKELEKPLTKRSRIWRLIRPLGVGIDGNITNGASMTNRLNSPDLIEQLKAEIRAEMKAEMQAAAKTASDPGQELVEATIEEKPKRKKKSAEMTASDEPNLENA